MKSNTKSTKISRKGRTSAFVEEGGTGGIQISFLGFIIPLEEFRYPSRAVYNYTGGIQISFLVVYNSTGGIQISFPGGYNSTGWIQISFQGGFNF